MKSPLKLNRENYENIFNVYFDEKNKHYFYNLLQTIKIPSNLPNNLFTTYTISYGDTWPYISFKTLNTPNLWWLILICNNIINPTIHPQPGDIIKIPIKDVVQLILNKINNHE